MAKAASVLVAVVVVVVVAVATTGGGDDGSPEVLVNGDPLPASTGSQPDPAVGRKAPVFRAEGRDGTVRTVGSGGGPNDPAKVVLFVAPECEACVTAVSDAVGWVAAGELPDLVAFEVVLVSPDSGAAAWLDELGWSGERYLDSRDALKDGFGIDGVPVWLVHDRNNIVLARSAGRADVGALIELASAATG